MIISQTVTDRANITVANTGSRLLAFDLYIDPGLMIVFNLVLMIVFKFMRISTVNISQTVTDRINIIIAITQKSSIGFRLVYLHLTLCHSNGHGQGHANFD